MEKNDVSVSRGRFHRVVETHTGLGLVKAAWVTMGSGICIGRKKKKPGRLSSIKMKVRKRWPHLQVQQEARNQAWVLHSGAERCCGGLVLSKVRM